MKRIQDRRRRKLCRACRQHAARFLFHRVVRWDPSHVLCPRCWRAERDRMRVTMALQAAHQPAEQLADQPAA